MNVYEQVKNMSMDEFKDHQCPIDNEDWFYCCYPESDDVYPDTDNMRGNPDMIHYPDLCRPRWWPNKK